MALEAKLVSILSFLFMFELRNTSATMCHSPQFLQLGMRGVVSCRIPETFYGVYWYNASNVTSDYPVIQLTQGNKDGDGYISGEFDISPDGSLIINEVSLRHNQELGVLLLPTDNNAVFENVRVIVFATPSQPYPSPNITGCEFENFCVLTQMGTRSLSCSVDEVGEVIDDLFWKLRTIEGDKISSKYYNTTKSDYELQSYRVEVSVPLATYPALRLYVCSSTSHVPGVGSSERAILVDHGTLSSSSDSSPTTLYAVPNEILTITCGKRDALLLVWRKWRADEIPKVLAFRFFTIAGERSYDGNSPGITFQSDNSLVIRVDGYRSEGVYACVYSEDGLSTSISSYKIKVVHRSQLGIGVVMVLIVSTLTIVLLLISAAVVWRWYNPRISEENPIEVEPDPEEQEMQEPEPEPSEVCDDVIILQINKLNQPHDVLTHGNEIFVLQNGGIQAYNMTDGRITKRWNEEETKPFAGVFLESTLYVTEKTYKCVMAFDSSLNFLRKFGNEHLINPAGITACKEDKCIYVLTGRTRGEAAVAKFNVDGVYVSQLLNEDLLDPWYIKKGPGGRFYISDFKRKTVDVFDSDFRRLLERHVTTMPGQTSELNCRGMDVDEEGNFFVALRAHGKHARYESIVKYANDGRHLETLEESPAYWLDNSNKSLQFVRGLHYYRSNVTGKMWLMAVDPGNKRVKIIPLRQRQSCV